jgi:histidyl-tRNA synthetase
VKLKKIPVTGMKDILPPEMAIRDYVIGLIKETYRDYGYYSIDTPSMEHIENLCSKQGGDNEKLIYKILKRGEKLKIDTAKREEDVVDCGMRYDLTLPLARYYASHANELPAPFKAMQIGNVWRADRPQKGRYRQFTQCDIDVLGESSNIAEIELILATTSLLGKLGFKGFTVAINDRRLLKAMAAYSGFKKEDYDDVFIILDKMDKSGVEQVTLELKEMGYRSEVINKYLDLFTTITHDLEGVNTSREVLRDFLEADAANSLETIIASVQGAKDCEFNITFRPTMVRGQAYYTGTIFEIDMADASGSVAGGGRYDEMIGKFTGQNVPAVGFSIGFERIIMLLLERNYQIPVAKEKVAFLLEKNIPNESLFKILQLAGKEREAGREVSMINMKKNKKFQKEQLVKEGYEKIVEYYKDTKV